MPSRQKTLIPIGSSPDTNLCYSHKHILFRTFLSLSLSLSLSLLPSLSLSLSLTLSLVHTHKRAHHIGLVHSNDIKKRRKHYVSDWTDAFKKPQQVIPAILFLYFACLSPAVSFGTIASQITNGSIGIVEFLLSCGVSGMVSTLCVEKNTNNKSASKNSTDISQLR